MSTPVDARRHVVAYHVDKIERDLQHMSTKYVQEIGLPIGRPRTADPARRAAQESFAHIVAMTGDIPLAAKNAGISVATAYSWIRQESVQNAVRKVRIGRIQGEGAAIALGALLEIAADKGAPAGARVQASKELLGLAGHSAGQAAADAAKGAAGAALHEMTADELERMIQAADATLAALRKQARVIDVAPDAAPESPDPASFM
jgi:hypothetical protein